MSAKIHQGLRYFALGFALAVFATLFSRSTGVFAQTAAPDFSKYGFTTVAGSVNFTPGTAATITAGGQTIKIPADFYSKPVTFELLTGTPATFAPYAGGRNVLLAFAFRVTDTSTKQLVGKFDKPVMWSYTDPAVTAQSAVFDVSAATPPTVVPNSVGPGTVSDHTIAHPFIIATVGWLVANPSVSTTPAASALPASGTGGLLSAKSDLSIVLLAGVGGVALLLGGVSLVFARQHSHQS